MDICISPINWNYNSYLIGIILQIFGLIYNSRWYKIALLSSRTNGSIM